MEKDYYEILKISKNATKKEIKEAYRKLAMIYHPDRKTSKSSEESFKEINIAHETLIDDEKRIEYDDWLETKSKYGEYDIFIESEEVDHMDYLRGISFDNKVHDVEHDIPTSYDFKKYKIFRFKGFGYYDEENDEYGDFLIKVWIKNYNKENIESIKRENYWRNKYLEEVSGKITIWERISNFFEIIGDVIEWFLENILYWLFLLMLIGSIIIGIFIEM